MAWAVLGTHGRSHCCCCHRSAYCGLIVCADERYEFHRNSARYGLLPHGAGISPSLPGNLVKQFDGDMRGAHKVPMTYGSDSNPTGRSVAWWAFHNVDDVATVFPWVMGSGVNCKRPEACGSPPMNRLPTPISPYRGILAGLIRSRSSGTKVLNQPSRVILP